MKQKHMLSLLQTNFTTVNVRFEGQSQTPAAAPWAEAPRRFERDVQPGLPPVPTQKFRTYTYKTKDRNLQPGDRVIVEREHSSTGFAIGIVDSIDPTPRIDVDADFDYKWIVQRIDTTEYDATNKAELAFQDQLQEVERANQREQLMAKMSAHLPENSQARTMFDAAVASFSAAFGAQPAIAAPAAPTAAPAYERAYGDAQAAGVCEQVPGMACK